MTGHLLGDALRPLDRHLPGFVEALRGAPLVDFESPGNKAIAAFRDHGGAGLVVPEAYGGAGLTAAEAVQVQIGLGAISPSTAIAVTMHQFTIAALVEVVQTRGGMEWMVIEAVARQQLLVASGFAEGDPNGLVLRPTMRLERRGAGFRLTGRKSPCSLSESMDLIAVSAIVPDDDGDRFAVSLVPASSAGLSVSPMWESPILAGAETGCVTFDDVAIPTAALSYVGGSDEVDATQVRSYVWFEILIAASYLGAALGLVDRSLGNPRITSSRVTQMASELELAAAGLDSMARSLDDGQSVPSLLARTLLVRYGVERSLQHATDAAVEALGVVEFASSPDAALLLGASRALSFHPPSRSRAEDALARYVAGGDFVLEHTDEPGDPHPGEPTSRKASA